MTWLGSSRARSSAMSSTVVSSSISWLGLARPSGRTAVASPHTRPHPLAPKRAQRRRTRSVGRPSVVPSQPSIGSTAKRLGTVSVAGAGVVDRDGSGQRAGRVDLVGDGMSTPELVEAGAQRVGRRRAS